MDDRKVNEDARVGMGCLREIVGKRDPVKREKEHAYQCKEARDSIAITMAVARITRLYKSCSGLRVAKSKTSLKSNEQVKG